MVEVNSTYLLTQAVRAIAKSFPKERQIGHVVKDLRSIRFDDDGVLRLVDDLIAGKRIDFSQLEELLTDFNDREWQVADCIARFIEGCSRVSNLTREELQLIAWRKPSIRKDLQEIVNPYGQRSRRIDLANLKRVRTGISDLNRAIDEADDLLLHGRHPRARHE